MHVHGLETGPIKRRRHLHLAVDALLAQNCHPWPRAPTHIGCAEVLLRIKRQRRCHRWRSEIGLRRAFGSSRFRRIAHRLQSMGHLPPGIEQFLPVPFGQNLVFGQNPDPRY